ncbi:MAG: Crp/Fnr family transcriptional regulator [Chloroflexi bacterium]|nr:Crp/Fnr family transcriptional regulator [Chloroflexota bacterium]
MLNHSDPRRAGQRDLQTLSLHERFFNHLSPVNALEMCLAAVEKQFAKDSYLLREGQDIEEVYIIQEGLVAAGLYRTVSPSLWLYVAGPGTLVDSYGLLGAVASPVSIVALSDVKTLAIPRERFAEIMGREPAVENGLLRSLSGRLSMINQVAFKELTTGFPAPSRN